MLDLISSYLDALIAYGPFRWSWTWMHIPSLWRLTYSVECWDVQTARLGGACCNVSIASLRIPVHEYHDACPSRIQTMQKTQQQMSIGWMRMRPAQLKSNAAGVQQRVPYSEVRSVAIFTAECFKKHVFEHFREMQSAHLLQGKALDPLSKRHAMCFQGN
eukprot:211014-Amphidinium_carterae.2